MQNKSTVSFFQRFFASVFVAVFLAMVTLFPALQAKAAVSVNWNGTSYSIPESGETNWSTLTDFLVALGTYAQTTGKQIANVRVATSSPITVATSDYTVITKLTVPGAVSVVLPVGVLGQTFVIMDGTGDANTNNITVTTSAAQLINASGSYTIDELYGAVTFQFDGTMWRTVSDGVNARPKFQTLTTSGAVSVGSTLSVTGASTLAALSATTGSFSSTLSVTGNTSLSTLGLSGVTTFPVGSVSAPSATFSGSTSTGFYLPSTDTLGFSTAGVLQQQINSVGDFTFGPSSSASNRTHTFRSGGTTLAVDLSSGDDTKFVALRLKQNSTTAALGLATGSSTFFLSGEAAGDLAIKAPSGKNINFGSGTTKHGSMSTAGVLEMVSYTASGVAVPTISSTDTLTNKTLTSPTVNTATISGGTINNASIGDTTPSSGAFTTLSSSGAVTLGASTPGTLAHTVNHSATTFTTGSTTSTTTSDIAVINANTTNGSSSRVLVRADAGNVNGIFQAMKGATSEIRFGSSSNHRVAFYGNNTEVGSYSAAGAWVFPSADVTSALTINSVAVPTISSTSTLTNKTIGSSNTLTGATAASFTNSGNTITLPTSTSTLATLALSETLANKTLNSPVVSGRMRLASEDLGSAAGTYTDFVPVAATSILRFTGATPTITGISSSQANGDIMYITTVGSSLTTLTIVNDATSTAANRILTGTGANVTITGDGGATLIYDGTTQRWRITALVQ